MHTWLIDILRNPFTGNKLEYNSNGNKLIDIITKEEFQIENEVPVLLQKESEAETNLHKDFQSKFNYIDHYTKDALQFDYFEEIANKATLHEIKRFHQTVWQNIPKNTTRLLDIGCGSAWIAKYATTREIQVVSLDISLTNTQKALKTVPSSLHAAIAADAYNLPFADSSFDCITACEITEHLYNPELFIEKIWKLLKPGGILIVTTPYKEKLEYNLCVHCNKPTPRNAHLHSFNKKNIQKLKPENSEERISLVGNTLLIKLKTHILSKFLPYSCWRVFDRLFTSIFDNAQRIVLVLKKTK